MSAAFRSLENASETDLYQEIESLIRKNLWTWQSVCALLGLVGGVFAPLLGAISDVVSWFLNTSSANSYLHVLSIVLCAFTLPLLTLGAISLDSLEAKNDRLSHTAEPTRTKLRHANASGLVTQQAISHHFGLAAR